MRIDGGCHCGNITYEAEIDPERVGICHCTDCQTLSGSAFTVFVPAPVEGFRLLTGQPKLYVKTAESGNRRAQGAAMVPLRARVGHEPRIREEVRQAAALVDDHPGPLKVELRYASLPSLLGLIASHYWFVVFEGDEAHRWEVWQTKNAGGRSIGHLHCDLKPPDDGVGGGPARLAAVWTGEEALRLKQVLESAEAYPFCHRYAYWPGPNSNTFAAWVLRKAGIRHALARRAIGRGYPC